MSCEKKKITSNYFPGSFTTIVGVSGSGEQQSFIDISIFWFPKAENFQKFYLPTPTAVIQRRGMKFFENFIYLWLQF